jgi:hypothetical protein
MSQAQERLELLHKSVLQNKGEVQELTEQMEILGGRLYQLVAHSVEATQQVDHLAKTLLGEIDACEKEMIQNLNALEREGADMISDSQKEIKSIEDEIENLIDEIQELIQFSKGYQTKTKSQTNTFKNTLNKQENQITNEISNFDQARSDAKNTYYKQVKSASREIEETHKESVQKFKQSLQKSQSQKIIDSTKEAQEKTQNQLEEFEKRSSHSRNQFKEKKAKSIEGFQIFQETSIGQTLTEVGDIAQDIKQLIESMSTLSRQSARMTQTAIEGMEALNVGFNVTVGTLNNVRDILDEISL